MQYYVIARRVSAEKIIPLVLDHPWFETKTYFLFLFDIRGTTESSVGSGVEFMKHNHDTFVTLRLLLYFGIKILYKMYKMYEI